MGKRFKNSTEVLIKIILVLFFCVFGTSVLIVKLYATEKLKNDCTEKVKAVVSDIKVRIDKNEDSDHLIYDNFFTFTYEEKKYNVKYTSYSDSFSLNDNLTLYIDPADPNRFCLPSSSKNKLLIIFLVLFNLPLLFMIPLFKRYRKERKYEKMRKLQDEMIINDKPKNYYTEE